LAWAFGIVSTPFVSIVFPPVLALCSNDFEGLGCLVSMPGGYLRSRPPGMAHEAGNGSATPPPFTYTPPTYDYAPPATAIYAAGGGGADGTRQ